MPRREIAQQAEQELLIARPVFANVLTWGSELRPLEALFDGFTLDTPSGNPLSQAKGYHFSALWTARNYFIKLKVMRPPASTAKPEMKRQL